MRKRQLIHVIRNDAFDLGSADGYADAIHGAPRAPDVVFARRHRSRPVADFADYELGYVASYEQTKGAL